jgi:hypothetical protein
MNSFHDNKPNSSMPYSVAWAAAYIEYEKRHSKLSEDHWIILFSFIVAINWQLPRQCPAEGKRFLCRHGTTICYAVWLFCISPIPSFF